MDRRASAGREVRHVTPCGAACVVRAGRGSGVTLTSTSVLSTQPSVMTNPIQTVPTLSEVMPATASRDIQRMRPEHVLVSGLGFSNFLYGSIDYVKVVCFN